MKLTNWEWERSQTFEKRVTRVTIEEAEKLQIVSFDQNKEGINKEKWPTRAKRKYPSFNGVQIKIVELNTFCV